MWADILANNFILALLWVLFYSRLGLGNLNLQFGEGFLALRIKLIRLGWMLLLLWLLYWLLLQWVLLVKNVLILIDELALHIVIVTFVVRVLLNVHFFLALGHDFDVGRIHLHVGRPVVQDGGWHDRHRVCQLAKLVIAVGKAAVDPELAVTLRLEVVAELSFVVTVQHSDILLAGEGLGQRLK